MKLSITKDELTRALGIISKGMSSRSTLPILSGIYIEAEGRTVKFQSTDLEISVKTSAVAFVERSGRTVVPGKLFNEIVKSLPDAAIQLCFENERFTVECMSSSFSMNTLNPMDFPQFPEISIAKETSIKIKDLSMMVKQVSRSVSRDESRAVLTGIYLVLKDYSMTLVSTDSYRLAVSERLLDVPVSEEFCVIIPGRILDEIVKCAGNEEELKIGMSGNQIVFSFGDTVFVTRKIEGDYPNYKRLIPASRSMCANIETAALTSAVKRVSLMAQSHSPIVLTFDASGQTLEISSTAQDVGNAKEIIPAQIDGETVKIAFNHSYILDGLASFTSSEITFESQGGNKPGIMLSEENGNKFLYLAMPVRL